MKHGKHGIEVLANTVLKVSEAVSVIFINCKPKYKTCSLKFIKISLKFFTTVKNFLD